MKNLIFNLILLLVLLIASTHLIAGTLNTFTLPERNACEGIYYGDIQASFPDVNFATLDRLYIPAQHYSYINLRNLPQRSADNPLVITNIGGQVRVGACGHYYNFVISGGSNWVLSGKYDATEQTGDSDFTGHLNGRYADTAGTYGILIDAEYGDGESGLSVGGSASDFEVSYVESRHLNFAGMVFKTDNEGSAHMDNVKIHDNYIHDTISEGVYLGSTQGQPQHKFHNLEFYNNRLIRTGTEIGQFGQLADGCRIHHNVFLLGAIDWKNPFQQYQDGGIQLGHREGSMQFDHNIVIGGASNYMILFNNDIAGDVHNPGDVVDIHDNYFSYSRHNGIYIHSVSDPIKKVHFRNNYFSKVVFSYDELDPSRTPRPMITSVNSNNPIEISDNIYDNQIGQDFYSGSSNITSSNNVSQNIALIQFNNLGWSGSGDYFTLEVWTALDIYTEPVHYYLGDLVVHNGLIYKALNDINYATATMDSPDIASNTLWEPQPAMKDDVRQNEVSAFADIGLLDTVTDLIYLNNFE